MGKKSLKNIIHNILGLCLIGLLASCSTDDNEAVAINSVTVTKNNAYIEEKITLNIDGTGYTDANLYSLNTATPLKFAKTAATTFDITSAVAAPRSLVFAQLKNADSKTESGIEVGFFTHGVDATYTYAEGIRPTDPSSKVLELLGAPTNKTTSTTDSSVELWAYPSKGISVAIRKTTAGTFEVNNINLNSSNFFTTMPDGTKVNYTNYAGDLGNAWKINNTNTKMDAIITKFGAPTVKASDPNDPTSQLRTYTFSNNTRFSFYGATENDYVGKVVQSFSL
ncbi:hypothetical protein [Flavobacterium sp. WC2509]|uniref:hypothetical protein n=1 Tax=Flavobacterium sp. WC2509 TaxID=3461406 RepID=UPI004043BD2E